MREERPHRRIDKLVCGLALLYAAASFVHHIHNAVYLSDYPNMPIWLTPVGVMLAWAFVGGVGAVGGLLVYLQFQAAGYCFLAVFAALGFCGLDHYAIARMSEHSFWMNATIIIEVATATALFLVVSYRMPKLMRDAGSLSG